MFLGRQCLLIAINAIFIQLCCGVQNKLRFPDESGTENSPTVVKFEDNNDTDNFVDNKTRDNETDNNEGTFNTMLSNCGEMDARMCMKLNILKRMRSFMKKDHVTLGSGLVLYRNLISPNSKSKGRASPKEEILLPDDLVNEDRLDNLLLRTTARFFQIFTFKWSLNRFIPGVALRLGADDHGSGVVEFVLDRHEDERQMGTGRLIIKKFLVPLLVGFKLKLATLAPIFFGALLAMSFKALILSKAALILTSVLGIKKILGRSYYEVLAHPPPIHHHASHGHGGHGGHSGHSGHSGHAVHSGLGGHTVHSGHGLHADSTGTFWSRSFQDQQKTHDAADAHNLAYNAYRVNDWEAKSRLKTE